LLDISAEVDVPFLEKYGLKPADIILAEPKHLPIYEDLVKNYKVKYLAGGAGQNTIRAAQWLTQAPNTTVYFGCIGKDEYGKILRNEATKDGVNVQYLEDETTPTGTCAVLIASKERALVANLSAANCYKKSHFDSPEIQTYVNNAKFFYITGFFLTVSPETMLAVGKHVMETNKVFLMNLSAPFLIDFFYDKMEQVLPFVDYVFGNEHEFAALGKKNGWGTDLKEIGQKLAGTKKNNSKPRTCIITQGCEPILVCTEESISQFLVPRVPKEEIVDTNGAGDSFVGGFLAMFIQGKTIEECIAAGNYVAGVTIRTSGGTDFRGKTPNFVCNKN
jgi:adenosine kinase